MKSNIIKNVKLERSLGNKKPDVLILDDNKNVIIYVEQKVPSKFKSAKDIEGAIKQEIDVAKALGALIYIVSDGDSFIWVNPKTGEKILDENGNEIGVSSFHTMRKEVKPDYREVDLKRNFRCNL